MYTGICRGENGRVCVIKFLPGAFEREMAERRRRERACGVGVVRHRFRPFQSIGNCVIVPAHRDTGVRLPGVGQGDPVYAEGGTNLSSPAIAAWSRPDM